MSIIRSLHHQLRLRWSERTGILFILLIGVWARFRYLTEIEHNIDHAYPVWQAMRTLEHGVFPLAGQGTSVLFDNPALTGYLFIPAVALTGSPLGVYVFVIALNSLAVWMGYRAVRGLLGVWPGLIAAALLAVNPWVIEYSRTSWVQSLLPFFVTAVAWLLWPVLTRQSTRPGRRVLLALVMATLLSQTYLLAFLIVAPVGVLLLIYRERVPWRSIAAGVGIFTFALALFAIGLAQNPDEISTRVDDFSAGESRITLEAFESAVRLVSGAEYELARGLAAPTDDADRRHDLTQVAGAAVMLAVIVGMGAAGYAIAQNTEQRDAGVILLVWFGLPVLAMSYTGNPVHPFYQLMGLPAGYGLAAWGLTTLLRGDVGRAVTVALLVPFAALMLINSGRYYEETAAIPGAHNLGALPVDVGLQLGDAIRQQREPGQVVFADEEEWILNSFAGETFGVIRDARAPALTRVPARGAVYVAVNPSEAPPFADLAEQITLADDTRIHIYTLPATADLTLPGTTLTTPTAQGITLLAYDLISENNTVTLQTIWRVDAIDPEVYTRIYAPFAHIFDASGERVAVIDGEGLRGDSWRVGELHIHRMSLTLPADAEGPFSVQVGQFDGINAANVVFLPDGAEPTVVIELPETIE